MIHLIFLIFRLIHRYSIIANYKYIIFRWRHPCVYHGRFATIGVGRIKAARRKARAPFARRPSRAHYQ